MAKLLTVNEWLEATFEENSRPCKKTVYRWIKKNPAMARRMGGKLYIVAASEKPAAETVKPNATVQRIADLM